MRLQIAIAAAVLFGASATSAFSAEFPARRAGLWTVTVTMENMKIPPRTNKMCIDAASDAKLMNLGMASKEANCTSMNVSGMGNTRVVDSICHMNGGEQKNHIVMNYSGDGAYHMDMHSQFAPPVAGHSESHITQDAKWIGPCPADMKPGDMLINGMKINMLDSVNHPMPRRGGNPYSHLTPEQIQAIIKAHGGH
jgi:hypothetical protein